MAPISTQHIHYIHMLLLRGNISGKACMMKNDLQSLSWIYRVFTKPWPEGHWKPLRWIEMPTVTQTPSPDWCTGVWLGANLHWRKHKKTKQKLTVHAHGFKMKSEIKTFCHKAKRRRDNSTFSVFSISRCIVVIPVQWLLNFNKITRLSHKNNSIKTFPKY